MRFGERDAKPTSSARAPRAHWWLLATIRIGPAAGDKYFIVYSRKGDPAKAEGTWRVVHGTGKFADMSGGGKWMPIGNFPASGMPNMFNGCNHEWGSYNMK